jgi:gluconolactonase
MVRRLVETEYYTEGPAVDSTGCVYFTTLTGGKIMKIDTTGRVLDWAESACPNGQRILENGDHLVCDSKLGKVIQFSADGRKIGEAAAGTCQKMPIRTPNDLVVDEGAGFYFTDSVRYDGCVYYFGDDGMEKVIARDLDYPNGIALSSDKRRLFVAESYKNRILLIELHGPGTPVSMPQVFCELPRNIQNTETGNLPDGIMIDTTDQLWVAHYGMQAVHVISPDGVLIRTLDTEIPLTSNVCFTENGSALVVTGGRGEPGPGNVHLLHLT